MASTCEPGRECCDHGPVGSALVTDLSPVYVPTLIQVCESPCCPSCDPLPVYCPQPKYTKPSACEPWRLEFCIDPCIDALDAELRLTKVGDDAASYLLTTDVVAKVGSVSFDIAADLIEPGWYHMAVTLANIGETREVVKQIKLHTTIEVLACEPEPPPPPTCQDGYQQPTVEGESESSCC